MRAKGIPFMPLPLFLVVRFLAPFVKRRFGPVGPRVVPALVSDSGRAMALMMGAVLGKARPDLIEPVARAYSGRPAGDERVHSQRQALARSAEDLLSKAHEPRTFYDLVESYPGFENSNTWADLKDAAASHAMYVLVGLEFGTRNPELTRRFVENGMARHDDEIGRALLKAGLKLPEGPGFQRYEEWEQFLLSEVEEWRHRWGAKADEWQRNAALGA
jgi:hypothetical protein